MSRKLLTFVFILFSGALMAQNHEDANLIADIYIPEVTSSCEEGGSIFDKIDSLLNYSEKFLGIPYVYGGKSPKGFDCSGYVSYIFRHFNISTPVRAMDYAHFGEKVSKDCVQPGDVICFKGRSLSSSYIGHVGIVTAVDGDEITFINAASSKGISYAKTTNQYWAPRVVGFRRIF
ncbi:MAG: C40 family peptidase [Chitinophagales bacterium]|nr:C40 family peptidase [Chitinophagales bacterium]